MTDSRLRCYGIVYLRQDGSGAGRVDYYSNKSAATKLFTRLVSIHGPHPNGSPRWRLVCFRQEEEKEN